MSAPPPPPHLPLDLLVGVVRAAHEDVQGDWSGGKWPSSHACGDVTAILVSKSLRQLLVPMIKRCNVDCDDSSHVLLHGLPHGAAPSSLHVFHAGSKPGVERLMKACKDRGLDKLLTKVELVFTENWGHAGAAVIHTLLALPTAKLSLRFGTQREDADRACLGALAAPLAGDRLEELSIASCSGRFTSPSITTIWWEGLEGGVHKLSGLRKMRGELLTADWAALSHLTMLEELSVYECPRDAALTESVAHLSKLVNLRHLQVAVGDLRTVLLLGEIMHVLPQLHADLLCLNIGTWDGCGAEHLLWGIQHPNVRIDQVPPFQLAIEDVTVFASVAKVLAALHGRPPCVPSTVVPLAE